VKLLLNFTDFVKLVDGSVDPGDVSRYDCRTLGSMCRDPPGMARPLGPDQRLIERIRMRLVWGGPGAPVRILDLTFAPVMGVSTGGA
jgi:hypothetical protein